MCIPSFAYENYLNIEYFSSVWWKMNDFSYQHIFIKLTCGLIKMRIENRFILTVKNKTGDGN